MSVQNNLNNIDGQISKIPVPEVGLGDYYQIDGYNVSRIFKFFFDLPRYDTKFQKTEVSILDWKLYGQSLIIYAAIAGIVAVGLSIFLILFCCCNCMFRSAAPRAPKLKSQRRSNRSSCILAFVISGIAIAGAATFVVGFIGEVRLHTGADEVCGEVNQVTTKMVTIKLATEYIEGNLSSIDLDSFTQPLQSITELASKFPDNPQLQQQMQTISSNFDSIKQQVEDTKAYIQAQILGANFLDTIIDYANTVNTECPNVNKWLRVGSLLVLIILAVSSLLFIVGLCNNCFRAVSTIIGYIMFNVLILFGIFSFVALIGGSDLCRHAKPLIREYAREPMLDYYLDCTETNLTRHHLVKRDLADISKFANLPTLPGNLGNASIGDLFDQVQQYIDMASNMTGDFNATIAQIEQEILATCNMYLTQADCDNAKQQIGIIQDLLIGQNSTAIGESAAMLTKMQNILQDVTTIMGEVGCQHITPLLNHSLSTVCTHIYEAFFFFLINSLAATLCFYIMLIISVWMLF